MSVVSLLTDFGTEDEYAGVMKGVILSINPAAVIVDISHQIKPQQILQAAFLIRSAYRFFPEKTIHVIVVDPGVGGERAILAYKKQKHIFIAPDNGVLTLLLDGDDEAEAVVVQNTDFFLTPVSATFHGRDIFAPVAAYLSRGITFPELGPAMDKARIVRIDMPGPLRTEAGEITGCVMGVDHFGNLITNIDLNLLRQYGIPEKNAVVVIGSGIIKGISSHYGAVPAGHPLVVSGSRGFLEIAVSSGSAQAMFGAAIGDCVRIFKDK